MLKEMTSQREAGGPTVIEEERRLSDDIRASGGMIRPKRSLTAEEDASSEEGSEEGVSFWRLRNQVVTWRILADGISGKIPINEQMSKIGLAFRMWSEVIPLTFREMVEDHVTNVDILIAFGKREYFLITSYPLPTYILFINTK